MSDPFQEAINILHSLMEWKPDDLSDDDMPQAWRDAEEFLTRYGTNG